MRTLFKTIFIVALCGMLPSLAYWWIIKQHLRSAKKMDALEYALHDSTRHDIIFVGASRVIRHVDPAVIDSITGLNTYVLGIDGMGIVESNMLMQVYLRHHPLPEVMVINTDNNIFFTDGPLFNITDYFPYLKDSLIYACLAPYKSEYRTPWKQAWLIFNRLMGTTDYDKAVSLMPELTHRWYPPQQVTEYKGFQPVDHLWARNMVAQSGSQTITAREQGFKLLKEMIEVCRRKGVKPALLFTPQHDEAYTIFANHHEIMNRVAAIADSLNVPFFNYDTLYIRHDKKYFIQYSMFNKNTGFINYNHLNSTGARILSQALGRDLKQWLTLQQDSLPIKP